MSLGRVEVGLEHSPSPRTATSGEVATWASVSGLISVATDPVGSVCAESSTSEVATYDGFSVRE